MVSSVNLDAMISRADFAVVPDDEAEQSTRIQSLSIEVLRSMAGFLKKPDFQRETNHWAPQQVLKFLESFLDNELVPAIILWKSPRYTFVIDGAHRLSCILAWINDDYGNGHLSKRAYGTSISKDQIAADAMTRSLIDKNIGRYDKFLKAKDDPDGFDVLTIKRVQNMYTRQFDLQWVVGNADKAEASFFNINTKGTPLNKTEEQLLRHRKTPIPIAARAIVRAGSGHKYWSGFDIEARTKIEALASDINYLLFAPEPDMPLKTLDLPLGGMISPVNTLTVLMNLLTISTSDQIGHMDHINTLTTSLHEDEDGSGTIRLLNQASRLMRRMTGNDASSLGLHPAVWFYSESGKHNLNLFLGVAYLFACQIAKPDATEFFRKFIKNRQKIEQWLLENKSLLMQIINLMRSTKRLPGVRDVLLQVINLIDRDQPVDNEILLQKIGLAGKILNITEVATGSHISKETRSEVFIRDSLSSAMTCPICNGYIDGKSINYDHIQRKRDGGTGHTSNVQITHPFCNTTVKN